MFVHTVIMVIEPHMKQGRQHKLISTIFLATSVTKKLDHNTLLINLGFDSFDIAKRLGHTVDMVNNIYGHWFNDAQIKMVDKLNSI